MTDLTPRPGRPRQLYCPDCKKEGRPFERKKPGQGYCAIHHSRRTKESYVRRMKRENPEYTPRELLAPSLVDDIKAHLASGHEMPVDMIQSLFSENGLPVPSEQDVMDTFYPQRVYSQEDLDAAQANMEAALRDAPAFPVD